MGLFYSRGEGRWRRRPAQADSVDSRIGREKDIGFSLFTFSLNDNMRPQSYL